MEAESGEMEVEAELVSVEVVSETEEQGGEAELNMEDAAQSSEDEAAGERTSERPTDDRRVRAHMLTPTSPQPLVLAPSP